MLSTRPQTFPVWCKINIKNPPRFNNENESITLNSEYAHTHTHTHTHAHTFRRLLALICRWNTDDMVLFWDSADMLLCFYCRQSISKDIQNVNCSMSRSRLIVILLFSPRLAISVWASHAEVLGSVWRI